MDNGIVKQDEVCATCGQTCLVWQVKGQKRNMGRGITLAYRCIACSRRNP